MGAAYQARPAKSAKFNPVVLKVIDGELKPVIPRPGRPRKHQPKPTQITPQRTHDRPQLPDTEHREKSRLAAEDEEDLESSAVVSPGPRSLSPGRIDPFGSTAWPEDLDAAHLLRLYVADPPSYSGSAGVKLSWMAEMLCRIRQRTWFPMCHTSLAVAASLVAFMAASGDLRVSSGERDQLTRRFLAQALQETNRQLSHVDNVASDQLALAVNYLMLVSQRTGDDDAFKAHSRGLALLLRHRQTRSHKASPRVQGIEEETAGTRLAMRPRRTPEESRSQLSSTTPPMTTQQTNHSLQDLHLSTRGELESRNQSFENLVEAGLLSRVVAQSCSMMLAWAQLAGTTRNRFDQQMVFFSGQHLWLGIFQDEVPVGPIDQLVFSGVRLVAHMISHPTKTAERYVCPVTQESTIPMMEASLAELDVDHLVEAHPCIIMWICVVAAYWVQDDAPTRQKFRAVFGRARGPDASMSAFIRKRRGLEEQLIWPPMLTRHAWEFWSGTEPAEHGGRRDNRLRCDCSKLFGLGPVVTRPSFTQEDVEIEHE